MLRRFSLKTAPSHSNKNLRHRESKRQKTRWIIKKLNTLLVLTFFSLSRGIFISLAQLQTVVIINLTVIIN